ncbi:DUF4214 domain-containing protein [Methylobacterium soli]|uniref:DUF4214 domain-containing protein n=1 Tax=Methylobacterium soli TaxID=553447 RepID=UPI00178261B2|nr:DUF4214 domain-containing protein [Methylobacterium soli]
MYFKISVVTQVPLNSNLLSPNPPLYISGFDTGFKKYNTAFNPNGGLALDVREVSAASLKQPPDFFSSSNWHVLSVPDTFVLSSDLPSFDPSGITDQALDVVGDYASRKGFTNVVNFVKQVKQAYDKVNPVYDLLSDHMSKQFNLMERMFDGKISPAQLMLESDLLASKLSGDLLAQAGVPKEMASMFGMLLFKFSQPGSSGFGDATTGHYTPGHVGVYLDDPLDTFSQRSTGDQRAIYVGGSSGNTLNAGNQGVVFYGAAGSDSLRGGAGNDYLAGGIGQNQIFGYGGSNTAVYLGTMSNYTFKYSPNDILGPYFTVTGNGSNDYVKDVQFLQFFDNRVPVSQIFPEINSIKVPFGTVTHDANSIGGKVYALYDGILGRAPDPLGLEHYYNVVINGSSLQDVARSLLSSPEGQLRAGASSNSTFVEQLYDATLHRHSDAGGLSFFVNQLNAGTPRADVAISFSLSSEHLANLKDAFDFGVFVADKAASDVARIYHAVLDRVPDADGLFYWANQVKHGASIEALTQTFLATPEVQNKTGGMTNAQFVDAIYENALGRHAEAGGLAFWTGQLDHGASRVGVTTTIGLSAEAQQHHLYDIEAGWHLA